MDSEDETLQQISDTSRARRRQQESRRNRSEEQINRQREANRLRMKLTRAQKSIQIAVKKFENELMNIEVNLCIYCNEKYPDIELRSNMCNKCRFDKGDPKKFSSRNGMDPGEQPPELQGLTPIEEMLIAKCSPIVKVYKLKGGQVSYGGHVITFTQDVLQFVNTLPRHPSALGILIVRKTFSDGHFDFKVRRDKIIKALVWLKSNNIYYSDINLDMNIVRLMPEDGDISHLIPSVTTHVEEAVVNESSLEDFFESHVVKTVFVAEQNMLAESLKGLVLDKDPPLPWPRPNDSPIHEFTTIGYIAQCFPTLYPTGVSDFLEPRIRKLFPQEYFRHLFRYKDGRFAKHNTWRYFALNSVMRWSAITEGNVYFNQTRNSLPPTISELRTSLQGNFVFSFIFYQTTSMYYVNNIFKLYNYFILIKAAS